MAQDTVIGMASSAPAASVGLTLAVLAAAAASQQWSLAAILAIGLALLLAARYGLRSPFFRIPRESDPAPGQHRAPAG